MIIENNLNLLKDNIKLISEIDDQAYVCKQTSCFDSSIGKHIRHIIDLYECFFVNTHKIDYDLRDRDPVLEKNRSESINRFYKLINKLSLIHNQKLDAEVIVKSNDCSFGHDPGTWSKSTVRRELQYLLSHTMHHNSFIAVILKLQVIETKLDFGIAPSTILYKRKISNQKADALKV